MKLWKKVHPEKIQKQLTNLCFQSTSEVLQKLAFLIGEMQPFKKKPKTTKQNKTETTEKPPKANTES